MPQVITPALIEAMYQGFNVRFNQARLGVKPMWQRMAMEVPSTGAVENYGWLGQIPRMREWIGERVYKGLDSFGYQVRNRTWETTFTIKREQIEDDQYGMIGGIASADLGRSVELFPDELVFGLAKAGFSSPCFDGQNFFDANHPWTDENGVVQLASNMQAGSGAPWFLVDMSQSIKPLIYQLRRKFEFVTKMDPKTSDRVFDRNEYVYGTDGRCNVGFGLWQTAFGSKAPLTRANFRAAMAAMKDFKLDRGRPAGIMPSALVTGTSNAQIARDLIDVRFLTDSGASAPIENSDYKIVEIVETPWLS